MRRCKDMRNGTSTIINTNITINDGTSKSHLISAIANYEEEFNETVITAFITSNHTLIMDIYDGCGITQWYVSDVQKFLIDKTFDYKTFKLNGVL